MHAAASTQRPPADAIESEEDADDVQEEDAAPVQEKLHYWTVNVEPKSLQMRPGINVASPTTIDAKATGKVLRNKIAVFVCPACPSETELLYYELSFIKRLFKTGFKISSGDCGHGRESEVHCDED